MVVTAFDRFRCPCRETASSPEAPADRVRADSAGGGVLHPFSPFGASS